MKSAAILVIALLLSLSAHAQKLATIGPPKKGSLKPDAGTFAKITERYFNGDYSGMRTDIVDAFTNLAAVDGDDKYKFDFTKNYYSFVFVAQDPNADKPQLVRVLIAPKPTDPKKAAAHEAAKLPEIEFGNATLPGITRIYDVFMTMDKDASVGTTYAYAEMENPLHAQLISAAKLINIGEIASSLRIAADKKRSENAQARSADASGTKTEYVYFTVSEVTIPAVRANVTAKSTMNSGDVSSNDVRKASKNALTDISLHSRLISPCAVAIATAANGIVDQKVTESDNPIPEQTRKDLGPQVRTAIEAAQQTAPCPSELIGSDAAVPLRAQAIQSTIDRYVAIADTPDPKRMQNETVYTNAPLNRFSLGVIAGGMFNPSGDDRVKLSDEGKVLADPLSGAISIATLYIHPTKYFTGTASPTPAERFRFLVGYVATPEPGFTVGAGYLLFRGLTFNAGYAAMLVDRTVEEVKVGDTPTVSKPFRRGVGRTVWAGFGYNF